jgi:hypothetical protein
MSTERTQQPGDAGAVCAAATRSLSAHGVRLCHARTRESDDGSWTDPWSWEVGVANPAARSVQVRHFHAEDSPGEKLSEAVVRRWPWLDDDDTHDPEPGQRTDVETIEIRRKHYYGGPDRWIDWSDMPFYGPARALWPLEAILGVITATPAGSRNVRGDMCTRYRCDVAPGEGARWDEITLIDRPEPDDDWRALSADVCVDSSGLVRRIAWSPTTGKRFKPGVLPRLATRLDQSPAPEPSFDANGRLWNATEFWDYGCSVEISAPTNLTDSSGKSMLDIVRDLWRIRRKYKREHRGR